MSSLITMPQLYALSSLRCGARGFPKVELFPNLVPLLLPHFSWAFARGWPVFMPRRCTS